MSTELKDQVNNPKHYKVYMNIEAKDMIKLILNSELTNGMTPWQIACFKDVLKYRLRAGEKGDTLEDIAKANKYKEFGESAEKYGIKALFCATISKQ